MSAIVELVNALEKEVLRLHDEYAALHVELDSHRGKELNDTNLPEVNRLLKAIQEKFAELHPALNFIAVRHQYVSNITNHYNSFIDTIKKAGAQEEKKDVANG